MQTRRPCVPTSYSLRSRVLLVPAGVGKSARLIHRCSYSKVAESSLCYMQAFRVQPGRHEPSNSCAGWLAVCDLQQALGHPAALLQPKLMLHHAEFIHTGRLACCIHHVHPECGWCAALYPPALAVDQWFTAVSEHAPAQVIASAGQRWSTQSGSSTCIDMEQRQAVSSSRCHCPQSIHFDLIWVHAHVCASVVSAKRFLQTQV